jgi:hypothetical protein
VLCLAVLAAPRPARGEAWAWLQYGADGLEVRSITDATGCPAAEVDGVTGLMQPRASADHSFPITVCTLPLAPGAHAVKVGEHLLRAGGSLERILVIGDTGCRILGPFAQACDDPQQWPFRRIAAVAAATHPDLVIHVGDYHYRESACPTPYAGCAGSPYGDTWEVWRADFFDPAAPLLASAPWIFVRGNHEECHRGGKGFSRALDGYPFDVQTGCDGPGEPYAVPLPGLNLVVMDVAEAREERAPAALVARYRAHYAKLAALARAPTWVLQHRPIWSVGGAVGGRLVGDNKTLAAAAVGQIPDTVSLFVSGHHHIFQVLSYAADLPVQVVSGHGGDFLNTGSLHDPTGWIINGIAVKGGVTLMGTFGFSLIERRAEGWEVIARDAQGVALESCLLAGRTASCRAN